MLRLAFHFLRRPTDGGLNAAPPVRRLMSGQLNRGYDSVSADGAQLECQRVDENRSCERANIHSAAVPPGFLSPFQSSRVTLNPAHTRKPPRAPIRQPAPPTGTHGLKAGWRTQKWVLGLTTHVMRQPQRGRRTCGWQPPVRLFLSLSPCGSPIIIASITHASRFMCTCFPERCHTENRAWRQGLRSPQPYGGPHRAIRPPSWFSYHSRSVG